MRLRLEFEEGLEALIELSDTPCAREIFEAAPFESTARLWGDEIYFSTPVAQELDHTAKEVVAEGEVGYWPTGQALCLFFGPTPISEPGEIRPASAVNIVGRILSPLEDLRKVPEGAKVKVEKA